MLVTEQWLLPREVTVRHLAVTPGCPAQRARRSGEGQQQGPCRQAGAPTAPPVPLCLSPMTAFGVAALLLPLVLQNFALGQIKLRTTPGRGFGKQSPQSKQSGPSSHPNWGSAREMQAVGSPKMPNPGTGEAMAGQAGLRPSTPPAAFLSQLALTAPRKPFPL